MLYSVDFIGFTRDKLRANHGSMSSNCASKVLILEHRIDLSVAPANTSNVQQSQDSPTYRSAFAHDESYQKRAISRDRSCSN